MTKICVSITIEPLKEVKKYCYEHDLKISELIRLALKEYMK